MTGRETHVCELAREERIRRRPQEAATHALGEWRVQHEWRGVDLEFQNERFAAVAGNK